MKDVLGAYAKRVAELVDHVRGNEQATKQGLIAPLFALLGYDLSDPRECMPEYRADFGPSRSMKPVDWAFFLLGKPVFFVEAKEVGKKLPAYDEQLADYFAKATDVKLGILTNGVQWRFFTDTEHANVMDKEPFVRWDVLADEQPPFDFLTLLQKTQFNAQLIRTFAERRRAQNLLVTELARLLEPAPEFVKLVVTNVETRNLTAAVIDTWKPIVASAIQEWARQATLTSVLSPTPELPPASVEGHSVQTTAEEMAAFDEIAKALGAARPVAFMDTVTYFKVHLPERHTWVVCRLYVGKRRSKVWVPLAQDQVQPIVPPGTEVATPEAGWTAITLDNAVGVGPLADVLRAAWDSLRAVHPAGTVATGLA